MGERLVRSRRVGVELALLAVIVAAPLAGLIAYLLYDSGRRDELHASGLAMQMAFTTADRTARYVDTTRAALEAVARRPMVRAMDPGNCDPHLADLRETYGHATNIVVIDLEGRIICGATPPPRGTVVRTADMEMLRAMIAAPGFRLTKPIVGKISNARHDADGLVQRGPGDAGARLRRADRGQLRQRERGGGPLPPQGRHRGAGRGAPARAADRGRLDHRRHGD